MRETVRFDLARHTIREADLQLLPEVVETLSSHPIDRVRVEGHTDSTGTRAFNLWLSNERAATVRNWLVAHGVAKERISIQGFGPDQPVASNATRPGRIANRRVDIVVQAR
jgi:outer membrane protein OmpA-like peptidoglycan-associated protein